MALDKKEILSGPIVRKITPNEATIWLTLKVSAKIELSIWDNMVTYSGDEIEETAIATVEQNTIQIGNALHMVAVHLTLSDDKVLKWGHLYSYNLKFTTADGETKNFKSLGLLDVIDQITGYTTISYQADQLPSFTLPAEQIEDLKIIHGSCRNNDTQYEDALSFVDDIVKDNLEDPLKRPQQLFLSGDQIYADSVVGPLLHHLTTYGYDLLGGKETIPTTWENQNTISRWDANSKNFPAFIRQRLVDSEARFTTSDTANHLISFGEFVSMYLCVWSDVIWPEDVYAMKTFEEVFNEIIEIPDSYGAIFRRHLFDERMGDVEIFNDLLIKKSLEFLLGIQNKEILKALLSEKGTSDQIQDSKILLNDFYNSLDALAQNDKESERTQGQRFINDIKEWIGSQYADKVEDYNKNKDKLKVLKQTLPKVRRALANISTFMIFDDHDVTDDWNLNPSWRDRVYTSPLGKTIVRNGLMSYALFQDWGNRPDKYNRYGYFFELETNLSEELNTEQLTDALKNAFAQNGITLDSQKVIVKILHTGEWLLQNQENKDEFIIRKYLKNANGDEEILKVLGNPQAHLLNKISELFNGNNENILLKEDHIDFLLGLDFQHKVKETTNGRLQAPDNRSPLIKWHYTYEGPKHKVFVIDNRTQRSYVKYDGAPGNLSFNGMKDLIPENPTPEEDEVLFVVAPLPVVGPTVLDELIAPLAYKIFDLLGDDGEAVKSGMQGTSPDAIESWGFDPVSQEELFKRLAPYKKIILLSGDVHYGSSQRLCYWIKGNEEAAACFAQLTSSGFRNVMPNYIQTASQHFQNLQKMIRQNLKAERLGWHDHNAEPKPIVFPEGSRTTFLNDKLNKSPVIIPVIGWPEGTIVGEPDWSWRIENVSDLRDEDQRPLLTRVDIIEETDDIMENLQKIAARHINQAKKVNSTRQILFKSNLGVVTFSKTEGDNLYVHHNLYAAPYDGKPEIIQQQEVYTQHKISLTSSAEEKAPHKTYKNTNSNE